MSSSVRLNSAAALVFGPSDHLAEREKRVRSGQERRPTDAAPRTEQTEAEGVTTAAAPPQLRLQERRKSLDSGQRARSFRPARSILASVLGVCPTAGRARSRSEQAVPVSLPAVLRGALYVVSTADGLTRTRSAGRRRERAPTGHQREAGRTDGHQVQWRGRESGNIGDRRGEDHAGSPGASGSSSAGEEWRWTGQ